MKKLFCLLLSALLLISLCGCVPNTGNLRGEIETPSSSEDLRGEVQTPSSSENISDDDETPPTTSEPVLSLGKTENNRYHNDYFGVSCTLPSDWFFYTDEEIRELNNFTMDSLDEDFAENLKNATIIYDMFAKTPNGFNFTNITMEKLTPLQVLTSDLKTALESQFPTLESSYANMGYTNIQTAYQKVTVDGKEYDGMKLTAQLQGIDFYVVSICYLKKSYLVSVSVASLVTDDTDTLLSYYTIS